MKQETLEEAAKYYAHNYFDMHETNNYKALLNGFKQGAKWQEENSDKIWSNDDVMEILSDWFLYRIDEDVEFKLTFSKWFEQFKKK